MSSEKQVDNTTRNIILAVVFVLLLLAVWYYMSSTPAPVTPAAPATPATPVISQPVWTKTPSNFVIGGGAYIQGGGPEIKIGICQFPLSKNGIVGKDSGAYIDGKCFGFNEQQQNDFVVLDNNNDYEYVTGTGNVIVTEATVPPELHDDLRRNGITLDGNNVKLYGCQRKIIDGANYVAMPGAMIGNTCKTPQSLLDFVNEEDLNKITTLQLKRKL